MGRWFRFLLAIMVGAVIGALFGWLIHPAKNASATPASLKSDYKADYVLMVAEAYHADQDLALAASRLALLGIKPPAEIARQALVSAEPHYQDSDLSLMRSLSDALQGYPSPRGTSTP